MRHDVRLETIGGREVWGATVWFGGGCGGLATNARRYYYDTAAALLADAPKANAFMWSWCGELSWDTTAVDAYLAAFKRTPLVITYGMPRRESSSWRSRAWKWAR